MVQILISTLVFFGRLVRAAFEAYRSYKLQLKGWKEAQWISYQNPQESSIKEAVNLASGREI